MIAHARLWWDARSPRERGLLLAMAAIGAILVIWLIAEALASAKAHEEMRVARAVTVHKTVLAYASNADSSAAPGDSSPAHILSLAERAGLDARVTGGSSGNVDILIDAVRSDILFTWIAELERQERLRIAEARIDSNADATLTASLSISAAQ